MGNITTKPPLTKVTSNVDNPFITEKRKCTDVFCCIFFLLFWLGMIIIAIVSYVNGQPQKLVYGIDWMGRTCGAKAPASNNISAYDLRDYKYIIYPRITQDLLSAAQNPLLSIKVVNSFFGVCVRSCPNPSINQNLYIHAFHDYSRNPEPILSIDSTNGSLYEAISSGSPWRVKLPTKNILYRCLEYQEMNSSSYVRCTDPCRSGQTEDCIGGNNSRSEFHNCGSKGCTNWLATNLPSCQTVQQRTIQDTEQASVPNPIYEQLQQPAQMIQLWIGDIEKSAVPILVFGGLIAFIVALIWLFLLKYFAGFFVWFSIFLVMAILTVTTLFAGYRGALLSNSKVASVLHLNNAIGSKFSDFVDSAGFTAAENTQQYWATACYVLIVLDVITLLVILAMSGRVNIAIGIIREASKAVQAMNFLILFPVIPTIAVILLVIYFAITAAYISTCGSYSVATILPKNLPQSVNSTAFAMSVYKTNDVMAGMLIYHLFGLLWTCQFLEGISYMTIAGAVAEFYWTLDKKNLPRFPIFRSFLRTLRYHLGSIVFGSLIIAIMQTLRLVFEYIDQKTKSIQETNKFAKAAMCCCKCCLWCFEQCIKYMNINAYIIIAMKGGGFCSAIKESFSLLLQNAARVATVGIVSTFLILLGKIFIVGLSTLFMFLMIYNPPDKVPSFFLGDLADVSSPIFPMILTAILSYAISSFLLGVYETTIDTILLCFCEDCKVNEATGKYYMSDELLTYIQGAKKMSFERYKKNSDDNQESV